MRLLFGCGVLFCSTLLAQNAYVYVGDISDTSVLLAWGTTAGRGVNTIGRESRPMGLAVVELNGKQEVKDRNWVSIGGLVPDTTYPYTVSVNGKTIGKGSVRTHPATSDRFSFFVIGDYGNASRGQRRLAEVMTKEFQRRRNSDSPIRFVLTTGDNIYAATNLRLFRTRTGADDRDWEATHFRPYKDILAGVPFYATLGNHDCNQTEATADLYTYLDNFFFPRNDPKRWYQFNYGAFADFLGIDTTTCTGAGVDRLPYASGGDQHNWLRKTLRESKSPWKIVFGHHPPFNAGPGHGSSYDELKHFLDVFRDEKVAVMFAGHEHNFQFAFVNDKTGPTRFVVTGAGGELRPGNISRSLTRANIQGFAPDYHFLLVEVAGKSMKITPIGISGLKVMDAQMKPVEMPLEVTIP